jgi:hemerythrin superfamily protein
MAVRKAHDAIALLKADHRKVEDLFTKALKARDTARKQALVTQICTELTIHAMIEEEIFYPACTGQTEDNIIDEAYVEHDGAKVLISELCNSDPTSEFYDAKVKVLFEDIKHHVKEEEKAKVGIFAQARAAGLDLLDLGQRLMVRKQELTEQLEGGDLPPPETRSFTGHKMRQGKPVDGGAAAQR